MNNPFEYRPHPSCVEAMRLVMEDVALRSPEWQEEVRRGKMFGVLIAEDSGSHEQVTLRAYSGQILGRSDWEGYVPAVFDYLQPDGYFKQEEQRIVELTKQSQANEGQPNEEEPAEVKVNENKERSRALQNWLFRNFVMLNGRGERHDLLEIFSEWAERHHSKCSVPPGGSGECCAPKLLQYAFLHNLKPIAMAEFWYGESPKGIIRHHGNFYPACQAKCAPILEWMLQGVDVDENPRDAQDNTTSLTVLYEDDHIIAIDKPSGMLSVPGKSQRRSAFDILCTMRPECEHLMMVHRLDMDTSGILVAAKDLDTYRTLQQAFANHKEVKKVYYALTENLHKGVRPSCVNSTINLPLSPDYLNRPMQCVDYEKGKKSCTIYEVIDERMATINGEEHRCTLLRLQPLTGRTHQLRVHCAHPDGLNSPIIGDNLYGTPADRLYLHAAELHFGNLVIKSPVPF